MGIRGMRQRLEEDRGSVDRIFLKIGDMGAKI